MKFSIEQLLTTNKQQFVRIAKYLIVENTNSENTNSENTKSEILSIIIQYYVKLFLTEITNSNMQDDLLKHLFSLLFEYKDTLIFHTFDYISNIFGSENVYKFFILFEEDFKLIDKNLAIRILGLCDFHKTLNPLVNCFGSSSHYELEIHNGKFVISGNKRFNEEEIIQFMYLLSLANNCSNTFMCLFDRLIILRQTLICFLLIEILIHMNEYNTLGMIFNHESIIVYQEPLGKFPSIKIETEQKYDFIHVETFNLTYNTLKLMYDIMGKQIELSILPLIFNNSIFSEEMFIYHIRIICADRGCYEEDIYNIIKTLDFSNSTIIVRYCISKYVH